jgi:hypothetical protein
LGKYFDRGSFQSIISNSHLSIKPLKIFWSRYKTPIHAPLSWTQVKASRSGRFVAQEVDFGEFQVWSAVAKKKNSTHHLELNRNRNHPALRQTPCDNDVVAVS